MSMKVSGRNKLKGKIIEVQLGDIMALVTVQVGENVVDAVITENQPRSSSFKLVTKLLR